MDQRGLGGRLALSLALAAHFAEARLEAVAAASPRTTAAHAVGAAAFLGRRGGGLGEVAADLGDDGEPVVGRLRRVGDPGIGGPPLAAPAPAAAAAAPPVRVLVGSFRALGALRSSSSAASGSFSASAVSSSSVSGSGASSTGKSSSGPAP